MKRLRRRVRYATNATHSSGILRKPTVGDWGGFLGAYRWNYFATFTAKSRATDRQMRTAFAQLVRRLERVAQGRVHWFIAVEYDALGEQPHIHALIAAPSTISAKEVERTWQLGRSQAFVYDRSLGAAHYLPKTFAWNVDGYDCSKKLPPKWSDEPPQSREVKE